MNASAPTAEHLYTRKHWVCTHSGHRFDLQAPDPRDVDINDITWALSHINRYAGNARKPISVAYHSVWVAMYCWHASRGDAVVAMHALLHDASEAYTGDIISPVKTLPELQHGFHLIQARVQNAVHLAFNLPGITVHQAALIDKADQQALSAEVQHCHGVNPTDWGLPALDDTARIIGKPVSGNAVGARHRFAQCFATLAQQMPTCH